MNYRDALLQRWPAAAKHRARYLRCLQARAIVANDLELASLLLGAARRFQVHADAYAARRRDTKRQGT